MHETRFAAEMPALEMEIPGISYSGEEKTIDLSAASVTPEIKGTPFAKYVITNLTGKADSKYLTITFTCAGAFDVNYQGRLIIENKIFSYFCGCRSGAVIFAGQTHGYRSLFRHSSGPAERNDSFHP